MTNSERKVLREFVAGRLSFMFNQLKDNARNLEICEQQDKSEAEAEELLHKLEKADRITIRRHYEGETAKSGIEIDEAYLQGLRDSVKILSLLGVFSAEVEL